MLKRILFFIEHSSLIELCSILPFFLVTRQGNNSTIKLNIQRIMEAVIIAIITGIIAGISASYIAIRDLSIKTKYIENSINKIEKRMDRIENILWRQNEKE